MKNFIAGTFFGIVIATIGFTGLAKLLDNSVEKVKSSVQEHANK